jgi:hypothetical protein
MPGIRPLSRAGLVEKSVPAIPLRRSLLSTEATYIFSDFLRLPAYRNPGSAGQCRIEWASFGLGHNTGSIVTTAASRRYYDGRCSPVPFGSCLLYKLLIIWTVWRRARDSNPRYDFSYNGFQDRRFQPLTQLSAIANSRNIPSLLHSRLRPFEWPKPATHGGPVLNASGNVTNRMNGQAIKAASRPPAGPTDQPPHLG